LIQEYKETQKEIRRKLKDTKQTEIIIDYDLLNCNHEAYFDTFYYNEIRRKEERMSNLNWYLSNLNYAIQWMESGHEPGVYCGIENRFRVGERY
jgi:hypothetical protein